MSNVIYIRPDGSFVGNYDSFAIPDMEAASPYAVSDLIMLPAEETPEYADQTWLFPGWSESPSRATRQELEWRNSEMPRAQQNVTAIEYGEPGDAQAWKTYWLALRKWTEENPDFPDATKRPKAPS